MDEKHFKNILTRQLPKTGQTTMYNLGDDGKYESGWWKGRLNANNKVRFIAKTIGGDDVVIDRATGLMWAADGNKAGCLNGGAYQWTQALVGASVLDFAGFTDWYLPNIFQLVSLVDYGKNSPPLDTTLFPNTVVGYYQSSTTLNALTTSKWIVHFSHGRIIYLPKTDNAYLRCVRGGL